MLLALSLDVMFDVTGLGGRSLAYSWGYWLVGEKCFYCGLHPRD